ncbi:MAG: hypothetical protein JWN33_452 [Candidatus Saccharibacteria bacterium]|nr:hypothetical protein [Candidatus Saccharibacteria bacterium]
MSLAAVNAYLYYIEPNHFADFELSKRMKNWPNDYPNTHIVITTIGLRRKETMNELRARTIGAHIAFELQMPVTIEDSI